MGFQAIDRATEQCFDDVMIRFAGHSFEPLPSGALYWRAEDMLLVADLHFEKMASFARRGQMLPPYDTGLTLSRLESDLARTRARTVIALGDSFHREDGASGLTQRDRMRLESLTSAATWIWITGNHDPKPHGLGGETSSDYQHRGVAFCHEPKRGDLPLVAGHLHPAARVAINGRSMRASCFVADDAVMVLPAYGASTGSLNILGPAFAGLIRHDRLQVVMTGRDRVYPVSPKRLIGG